MKEIRNPGSGPGADKQMLIALALIFLVIFASQQFFLKNAPKPQPATAQQKAPAQQQSPASATAAAAVTPMPVTGPPGASTGNESAASSPQEASRESAVPAKKASEETETVVQNDLYKVTFTNRGALVKSWILKQHKDENGNPLDLVHPAAAWRYGYPLSLFSYDGSLMQKLNTALYVPSAVGDVGTPASIDFEYSEGDLSVKKSFRFDRSFIVHVTTEVRRNGALVAAYPAWPAGFGDEINLPGYAAAKIEWVSDGSVHRASAETRHFFKSNEWIANGETVNGPFEWAGVSEQYFAAIFLPDAPASSSLVEFHNGIPQDEQKPDKDKIFHVLGAAVGNPAGVTSERLFVGPKALEILQSVHASSGSEAESGGADAVYSGPDLSKLVDFGFFGIIAKPLFLCLKWTEEHFVHNWGWAIVALTVVINLLVFPLRYSSMKSQLKMQKAGPEIKAINDRYKGVPFSDTVRQQEKNAEIQAVYKREGINPIAGCVPMLFQMPVLYAFYTVLAVTTELRHAPWLWIHDLSSPDPMKLLPVFMMVTMFMMQRATPMTGMDPQQARMMQIMMPLVFGFMSFKFASGLALYWATGNIIGWGLQYGINNSAHAKEVRAHLAKKQLRKK